MCCSIDKESYFPTGFSWEERDLMEELRSEKEAALTSLPRIIPTLPEATEPLRIFLNRIKPLLEQNLTRLEKREDLEALRTVELADLRNPHLITLVYLMDACDPEEKKLPFPKEFLIACKESREANAYTEKYLVCGRCIGWRGWTLVTIAACVSTLASISFSSLYPDSDPRLFLSITPILALIGALAAAYLGMCITGTNPHYASKTANSEQNEINNLKYRYQDAAKELITLFFSAHEADQALAISIARKIEISKIKKDFNLLTIQEDADREVFVQLEDAIGYILSSAKESFPFRTKLIEETVRLHTQDFTPATRRGKALAASPVESKGVAIH